MTVFMSIDLKGMDSRLRGNDNLWEIFVIVDLFVGKVVICADFAD